MSREKARLLKDLLGADYNPNSFSNGIDNDEVIAAQQRREFGDLPAEKIAQLRKIRSDYSDLTIKMEEASLGVRLPEDDERLTLLEREEHADIERLLTPAELLDYDLRNSDLAGQVRNRVGFFDATEEEFRALYVAAKTYDEQHPLPSQPSQALQLQREEAFATQQQNVLGAARYAEFQRTHEIIVGSPDEEQVSRLVTRLSLPPAVTASVVAVQSDVRQRAIALRTDQTLSASERTTQLASLAAEASAKLTETLGDRGFEAYKQNAGQWLRKLVPPPATAP
jgi:hypothetical protein